LKLKKSKNIYYSKNTSDKIIEILNRINFKDLSHKKFYDLNKNKN